MSAGTDFFFHNQAIDDALNRAVSDNDCDAFNMSFGGNEARPWCSTGPQSITLSSVRFDRG
jgi:hypothetical protein